MNWLEIALLLVAIIGGLLLLQRWWAAWHRQYEAAKHTYRAAEQDAAAATVFCGSMNLADEQDWRRRTEVFGQFFADSLEQHHVSGLDWREATMAELSPEALDPGLGGDASSPTLLPPGPDPDLDGGPTVSHPEGAKGVNAPPVQTGPSSLAPVWERLADTGDIRDAALLADTTTYMRDQDADVQDWLAGRAITWARLEIGALT